MELSQDETTNLMGCFSEIDETNLIYLKLLCKDVLGHGQLSNITLKSLPTLFTYLQQKCVISTGNFSWLRKCFNAINRKDLAQRLPRDDVRLGLKDTTTISPFRMLTVEIAMDITETELQLMKFALRISGGTADRIKNGSDLIFFMEADTRLADGKFDELKKALANANKSNIIKKIEEYETNTGISDKQTPSSSSDGITSNSVAGTDNHPVVPTAGPPQPTEPRTEDDASPSTSVVPTAGTPQHIAPPTEVDACPTTSDGNSSANESSNSTSNQDSEVTAIDGNHAVTLENINAFEKELVKYFKEKLGKYQRMAQNATVGKKTARAGDVAVGFSSTAAIAAAVVTAVVALPVAAAATMGAAGPVAVLGTVVIGQHVIKIIRQRRCKLTIDATKDFAISTLGYIVEQAGKELSRIYEYQLSMLEDAEAAKIMARSAVDLMLNLKDGIESFDSNTLLRRVLDCQGSKKVDKKKLETKYGNREWRTPDVFWKPGLRKIDDRFNDERREETYKFNYKKKPHGSEPQKYGFRGEFLLLDTKSSISGFDHDRVHFIGSGVDKTYNTDCDETDMQIEYQPYHCLVLQKGDLKCFSKDINTQPSFAHFTAKMHGCPAAHVKPVYRPKSPVNEILDLTNANLSESDFTAANFMGYTLEECNLEKCVSLFGIFKGAVFNGAKFTQARLIHCNLDSVKASQCTWTQATIHDCQVEDADFSNHRVTVDSGSWEGTDLSKATSG